MVDNMAYIKDRYKAAMTESIFTGSPDEPLFRLNIVELYDNVIDILNKYSENFDDHERTTLVAYASAILDTLRENNTPMEVFDTIEGLKGLIEEMWQMDNAIVEDMAFRRGFILICKLVKWVAQCCWYRMDYEEDWKIECGGDEQ